MRTLLVLLGALIALPIRAQEATPEGLDVEPTTRIAMAVARGGPLDAWSASLDGVDEPVSTEIVLTLSTDSTGTVEAVEIVSAPLVSDAVQRQIAAAVMGMALPGQQGYTGAVTFAWNYMPGEERRPSPLLTGVLAGLAVGITALVLALLE